MKVSICLITFNHEKYIEEALKSCIDQNVKFPYEIVIGEDCSQDATPEIIKAYQTKFPDLIRLLPNRRNLGAQENFIRTYHACRGTYVATLDGDDYWTCSNKLQRQVDFLDRHPDYSMVFHAVRRIYPKRSDELIRPPGCRPSYELQDYATDFGAAHSSVMFRRSLVKRLPTWYYECSQGDRALQVLYACKGAIGYIDDVMSIHRSHEEGLGFDARESKSLWLEVQLNLAENFMRNVSEDVFRPRMYKLQLALAHSLIEQGDAEGASEKVRECQRDLGYGFWSAPAESLKFYAHLRAPRAYKALRFFKYLLSRSLILKQFKKQSA